MSHRMIATLLALLGVLQPALAPVVAQGQQEGIKVHGHWVIDVRNSDGTLASHTEFENALTAGGAMVLTQILTNVVTVVRGWTVTLRPGSGAPFGVTPNGNFLEAQIFQPAVTIYGNSATNNFPNLTVHPNMPRPWP